MERDSEPGRSETPGSLQTLLNPRTSCRRWSHAVGTCPRGIGGAIGRVARHGLSRSTRPGDACDFGVARTVDERLGRASAPGGRGQHAGLRLEHEPVPLLWRVERIRTLERDLGVRPGREPMDRVVAGPRAVAACRRSPHVRSGRPAVLLVRGMGADIGGDDVPAQRDLDVLPDARYLVPHPHPHRPLSSFRRGRVVRRGSGHPGTLRGVQRHLVPRRHLDLRAGNRYVEPLGPGRAESELPSGRPDVVRSGAVRVDPVRREQQLRAGVDRPSLQRHVGVPAPPRDLDPPRHPAGPRRPGLRGPSL